MSIFLSYQARDVGVNVQILCKIIQSTENVSQNLAETLKFFRIREMVKIEDHGNDFFTNQTKCILKFEEIPRRIIFQ